MDKLAFHLPFLYASPQYLYRIFNLWNWINEKVKSNLIYWKNSEIFSTMKMIWFQSVKMQIKRIQEFHFFYFSTGSENVDASKVEPNETKKQFICVEVVKLIYVKMIFLIFTGIHPNEVIFLPSFLFFIPFFSFLLALRPT